jgi:hypothetical protein
MKYQITPAAVALMASGRKIMLLAMLSYRTRSTMTAMIRPSPTVRTGRRMTHTRLLTSDDDAPVSLKNQA